MSTFFRIALLIGLLTPVQLAAQNLLISPVNLDMPPGTRVTELKLTNLSDQATIVQIRIQPWIDSNETERLIRAAPSMVKIEPQSEQLIRLVNTGGHSNAEIETMYRVLIDTLEPPAAISNLVATTSGIKLNVRYSLPLFVGGPKLSLARNSDIDFLRDFWQQHLSFAYENNQLKVRNRAKFHARLSKLKASEPSAASFLVNGLLGYVTPEQQELFALQHHLARGQQIEVEVNGVKIVSVIEESDHDEESL